ncbi:MAG TPA: dTMP kinase [Thermoanaerobaculia bacterium]|nr:dTMP kinase [Thermoanaerobaculia bacterium]HUM29253.1 dTMP kinase [Thermoanaerobaculia bacterium]HXK67789.1 dTMP kinase [Thermoanaerobaculia bacterium]
MARFITFEGVEGSGKSTQIELTSAWLGQKGIRHTATREPGGTKAGESIRQLLLHQTDVQLSPLTEAALFTAARQQLLQEIILPSLNSGSWVLCDRFIDSTIAYQGYGRGVGEEKIRRMHSIIGNIMPDITFFLDVSVETGLKRLHPGVRDRFESMDFSFHKRVRDAYLVLYKKEPNRIVILDGTRPAEDIQAEIQERLAPWCKTTS